MVQGHHHGLLLKRQPLAWRVGGGHRWGVRRAMCATVCLAVGFAWGTATDGLAASPAGRAYEMVSPVDKNGTDIGIQVSTIQSARAGGSVAFTSPAAFAGAEGTGAVVFYRARRGAGAWSVEPLNPRQDPYQWGVLATSPQFYRFSDDLSRSVVRAENPPLAPGGQRDVQLLYRRDGDGSYQLLTTLFAPVPVFPPLIQPTFAAATNDLSTLLFEDNRALTADAPDDSQIKLYEWREGTPLRLVGRFSDGTPTSGSVAGAGAGLSVATAWTDRALSEDGSRVYFMSQGRLYLRENDTTTWVSRSQATVPDVEQSAAFTTATPDGRFAYFTTLERLLDSDADSEVDVYRYDVETRELILISDVSEPGPGVLGVSDDGSRAYFGSFDGTSGYVYLWDGGRVRALAPLGGTNSIWDRTNWDDRGWFANSFQGRVTSDGRYAAFVSTASTVDSPNPGGFARQYIYDAQTGETTCVSCRPDGRPATSDSVLAIRRVGGYVISQYRPTALLDDGRLFFTTGEALVPGDTNGKQDAYGYDSQTRSVQLISTGTDTSDSYYADASADGKDVFFLTREPLVGWDQDANLDLYDARVGGGLPEPPVVPEPCSGDVCQGPPTSPPQSPNAETTTFDGPGDVLRPHQTQPTFRVAAIGARARQQLARRGSATLRVAVSEAGVVDMAATARLRGVTARVASARVRARRNSTVNVRLSLSRPARQALARQGALSVRVTVTFSKAIGEANAVVRLRRQSSRRSQRVNRATAGG